MGRKIPGKKHKGIKDPEKQREARLLQIKDKINAPPKNIDNQEIPKSLEEIIKLKNMIKNKPAFKKKRNKKKKLISVEAVHNLKLHPKAKPEKAIPIFRQKTNETNEKFWHRVNKETDAFLKETAFEQKYNVQVQRNPETGYITGIEKHIDEDNEVKMKLKHKNINKRKNIQNTEHLTKSQKKKQKLLKKKQEKIENNIDNKLLQTQDKINFGEIVHRPPEITICPRKATQKTNMKPGKKDLLLNQLLQNNNQLNQKKNSVMDMKNKSRKLKYLPFGERKKFEQQQTDIITAYRLMKFNKRSV